MTCAPIVLRPSETTLTVLECLELFGCDTAVSGMPSMHSGLARLADLTPVSGTETDGFATISAEVGGYLPSRLSTFCSLSEDA